MRKSRPIQLICCFLFAGIILASTACSGQVSASQVETAVAGTLAAAPAQPAGGEQVVEVTQIVEVTEIVEIRVTSTPEPTRLATETPEPTATTEATPTEESISGVVEVVTATPTPVTESGSLGLGFNQLINRYDGMTDLQKQEFIATLPGKTVYWIGQVNNIAADGTLNLDNPYGIGRMTLKGVDAETAVKINKNYLVEFNGMIEAFSGSLVPNITVTNVEIVRYYQPPTPTPTSR
jgi:hypothetical protein